MLIYKLIMRKFIISLCVVGFLFFIATSHIIAIWPFSQYVTPVKANIGLSDVNKLLLSVYSSSSSCSWASDTLDLTYSVTEDEIVIDVQGYRYKPTNPYYNGSCARVATYSKGYIELPEINTGTFGTTSVVVNMNGETNRYLLVRSEFTLELHIQEIENIALFHPTNSLDRIIIYPDDVLSFSFFCYSCLSEKPKNIDVVQVLNEVFPQYNFVLASDKYPDLVDLVKNSSVLVVYETDDKIEEKNLPIYFNLPEYPDVKVSLSLGRRR